MLFLSTLLVSDAVSNEPPVAYFTKSAETVLTGQFIYFDASDSYDPDGYIVSYFWDLGDGTNATGVVIDHSYVCAGNYTVTLTVTDDDGATDTAISTMIVLPYTVEYPYMPPDLEGDVNNDGKVDMKDIFAINLAFGSRPGYPDWDPRADLNNDGVVDMKDIFIVILNFGEVEADPIAYSTTFEFTVPAYVPDDVEKNGSLLRLSESLRAFRTFWRKLLFCGNR